MAPPPTYAVDIHEHSVVQDDGYRIALDCDVLFSCVDRPWPRQLLDHIAYAHLIPVIDGGIAVRARPRLTKRRLEGPHRSRRAAPCLQCLGQYLPSDVTSSAPVTSTTPPTSKPSPRSPAPLATENVYAFSMACASLEILQWLSMSVAPLEIADVGSWNFHFVTGEPGPVEQLLQTRLPTTAHPRRRGPRRSRRPHRRAPRRRRRDRYTSKAAETAQHVGTSSSAYAPTRPLARSPDPWQTDSSAGRAEHNPGIDVLHSTRPDVDMPDGAPTPRCGSTRDARSSGPEPEGSRTRPGWPTIYALAG